MESTKPQVTADQIRESLQKILVSKPFRNSSQPRKLLTVIVNAVLKGDREQLKGCLLADACNLTDDRLRPAVGRLREKLGKYYAAEGASDLIRISVPVGGYVPIVEDFKSADTTVDVGDQELRTRPSPLTPKQPGEAQTDEEPNLALLGKESGTIAERTLSAPFGFKRGMARSIGFAASQLIVKAAAHFAPESTAVCLAEELANLPESAADGDKLIVLMPTGMFGYWEAPVITVIEKRLSELGDCRFVRAYIGESPQLFVYHFQNLLRNCRPAGFLVMLPPSGLVSASFRRWVQQFGMPFVTLDRESPGGGFICIEPDHQWGAAHVSRELLKDRPAMFVYVMGNRRHAAVASRKVGFIEETYRHRWLTQSRIKYVPLGDRVLGKGPFPGVQKLIRVIRDLDPLVHIAFFADNPERGSEVIHLVNLEHGYWPDRWVIGWFDGNDELKWGSVSSIMRPTQIIGCKVDKETLACEGAERLWIEIVRGPEHSEGTPRLRKIRPSLQR